MIGHFKYATVSTILVSVTLFVLDQVLGDASPGLWCEGSGPGARPNLEETIDGASDELLARRRGQDEEISVTVGGSLALCSQPLKGGAAVALDGSSLASLLPGAIATGGKPNVDTVGDSRFEDLAQRAPSELRHPTI